MKAFSGVSGERLCVQAVASSIWHFHCGRDLSDDPDLQTLRQAWPLFLPLPKMHSPLTAFSYRLGRLGEGEERCGCLVLMQKINIYEPTFYRIVLVMLWRAHLTSAVYTEFGLFQLRPVMPGKQANFPRLHPQQTQESMACYKEALLRL